jgi:hypothetical protein
VLGRIFGTKRKDAEGGRRKIHEEELNLYSYQILLCDKCNEDETDGT